MVGPFIWRTLLLSFLFHPALWAADSPFIQTLQIRGSRRPLELETRSGQTLDLVRIEHDVRRLWATGWFNDILVESSPSVEGVQLVFTLAEKPRLHLRRVEFDPENERRPLGLEKGTPIDAVLAKRVAAALRQQLVEQGHAEATVEAGVIPVGFQQADLRVRVERGRAYRVQEMRFSGSLGLKPNELRGALRATRARRLLPGVGPLWRGWRLLAPLSQQRLQADVERLQSLYLSRGYFDAKVGIATVDTAENKATVTLQVDAGRRYRVERLEVVGAESIQELPPQPDGTFSSQKLCQFLLEARRESEREGKFGFTALLEAKTTSEPLRDRGGIDPKPGGLAETGAVARPWVALKAKIETGAVYSGLLSLVPQADWQPLVALERPYLPGQRWQSGFLLSPQLGWRGTLSSYGLAQARQSSLTALGADSPPAPAVSVPVRWSSVEGDNNSPSFPSAGILRCEPRKSSLAWLQAAGAMAANWLLSVSPL